MERKNQKIEAVLTKLVMLLRNERKNQEAQIEHICELMKLPEWVEALGIQKFLDKELQDYCAANEFSKELQRTIEIVKAQQYE